MAVERRHGDVSYMDIVRAHIKSAIRKEKEKKALRRKLRLAMRKSKFAHSILFFLVNF